MPLEATSGERSAEDAAERIGDGAAAEAKARRPRLRLSLRTVIIVVSVSVLLVPLLGVYMLRLHETTLLRQTQHELKVATTLLAGGYAAAYAKNVADAPSLSTPGSAASRATAARPLDFSDATRGPWPEARHGPAAAPVAAQVGAALAPMLTAAAETTAADIRLLDHRGVVVASTADDVGLSLAHAEEVRQALAGFPSAGLRPVSQAGAPPVQPLVRGAATRAHVAIPVHAASRLIGVVTAARTPSTVIDTLVDKRHQLLQGAILILGVALGIAVVTARTLALPIQRLRRNTREVAQGQSARFDLGRHLRVRELAELADSIETMVVNLQRRTHDMRDFVRHVNHAFKTPLAAARGAVELLSDHADDMTSTEARHFIGNLNADLARLDRLTNRLLELAQADLAATGAQVTDVLAVARQLANPVVRVHGDAATVRAPAASVRAVLENLVDNAVQNGASQVDVRAARHRANVELSVADNGAGIAPADRSHVFDPFYTTRSERGGTGLGLAICRALVETAGGGIALAASDNGATFTVALPAAGRERARIAE